jgi:hypothetical protein
MKMKYWIIMLLALSMSSTAQAGSHDECVIFGDLARAIAGMRNEGYSQREATSVVAQGLANSTFAGRSDQPNTKPLIRLIFGEARNVSPARLDEIIYKACIEG